MDEYQTSMGVAAEGLHDPGPLGPTRYERHSGSLPHLEDQMDGTASIGELPSPITAHLTPLGRLRSLIGS
jgi:hypothetical protein